MNNALLFDLLILLFVLLFALIGFWRGVVKEGLASGGVLFGALLADSWSDRAGTISSNVLNVTTNASRFFAVEALLVAVTLVIGYGAGALLVPHVRGLGARLGGAVLGAINATLLLAFSLRAVDAYVNRASTRRLLEESHIAHALVFRFNWMLLIVTGIVVVLLFGRLVTEREPRVSAPARTRNASGAIRRVARLPAPADAGKLEPIAREFDENEGRYQADVPGLDALTTMPVASPSEASEDRAHPRGARGHPDIDGDEWRTIRFTAESPVPAGPALERRCATCGEVLTSADDFCPTCGQPTTRSESTHDADA